MSDKESAQSVIEAHRKRQERSQKAPLFLGVAAILLVIIAAVVIFMWLSPDKPVLAILSTETSTPTVTPTDTPTSTATATATDTPTEAPPTETPTPTATETPSGPSIYIVQEGDVLAIIAERFGVDLATLLALNPQIDPKTLIIRIGDEILIPAPDTQLPTATPIPSDLPRGTIIEYAIVAGDNLAGIAMKFNSSVDDILKANPEIENANDIQAGQIIKIPVNMVTPVPTATVGTVLPTAIVPPTQTPQP